MKIEREYLEAAGHLWHSECFRCSLCKQPFPDHNFIVQGDLVLHHQCLLECYAERCAKCTNLVDKSEGTKALGKIYHTKCFTCTKCGMGDLTSKKFDNIYGFPYCRSCFDSMRSLFPLCLTCQKPIYPTQQREEYFFNAKKYYAHKPDCFKCHYCTRALASTPPCVYDQKLICKTCFDSAHQRICAYCNDPIFDQPSIIESIYWHTEHFVCTVCKTPLKPNTNILSFGILKCRTCAAEERPKCSDCGKPIGDDLVIACGQVWHRGCLKCQNCGKTLQSKQIFTKNGQPYCKDCNNLNKEEMKDMASHKSHKSSGKSHSSGSASRSHRSERSHHHDTHRSSHHH
jgi:hypothetical protein